MKTNKCKCSFCKTHELEKWATVMECKCCCHEEGFVSHDGLCCSVPNVLKRDNPYKDLKPASEYKEELNKMYKDAEDEYDSFREASR